MLRVERARKEKWDHWREDGTSKRDWYWNITFLKLNYKVIPGDSIIKKFFLNAFTFLITESKN